MKKKLKKKIRKLLNKPEPKSYAVMEPTEDPWKREGYIKRRTSWMWRLRPWLMESSKECSICKFKDRCQRIPVNEQITAKIAKTGKCPDFKSMWKSILGNEEKYDWGF